LPIYDLVRRNAGADVVSEGELLRARAAGIAPDKIMFSGVGKTARELALAVDEGILCVNVEPEPDLLAAIATAKGRAADISIRVNPDIDPKTHAKIATGKAENKFSIPISRARDVYTRAAKLDGVLGMPYREDNEPPPDPNAYATVVKSATRDLDCQLIFEPGRLIVGNAGILVTRVLYVKRGEAKTFVIVDAGMNDLVRPTLYDAHHDLRPVKEAPVGAPRLIADLVGPVCESGDFIAQDRPMTEPKAGDLVAIMSAGAYGAVQASTYNTRALVPEVLVRKGEWALVRPRIGVQELIALDRVPSWL